MDQPRPRDGIVFQTTEAGAVLLDTAGGQFFGLSPVASVTWTALAVGADLDQVVAAVLEAFEIDEATACTDIHRLLDTLDRHGLLESAP